MKLKVTRDKQFVQIVDASEAEIEQMQISFTRTIENAKYRTKKTPYWKGDVKFIDSKLRIPFGLWDKVEEVAKRYKIKLEIEGLEEVIDLDFDEQAYKDWETDFYKDSVKKPREYQTNAVIEILKWKRSTSEIATSAGKTNIVFNVFAYLKHLNLVNQMLVIVPSIDLVLQGIEDFEEYSNDKTLIKYTAQAIGGGNKKTKQNADIIFGTFQTLVNLDPSFFKDINIVAVDECHIAKTTSLSTIFSKLNAEYVFGLSGTTGTTGSKAKYADAYTIQSLLGPVVTRVTPDYITSNGFATPVAVKILYLDYLPDNAKKTLSLLRSDRKNDGTKVLNIERNLVIENKKRFEFITNMISRVSKNSIVFFTDIKNSYGRRIYDRLRDTLGDNYKVMYIDGATKSEIRNEYKSLMDDPDDNRIKILVASFGTFSTGISINNLHNIFMCESYKSERVIKQTIGRGMRLHASKEKITIIDFVDDFTVAVGKSVDNYMLLHGRERQKIYKENKFKFEKFNIAL